MKKNYIYKMIIGTARLYSSLFLQMDVHWHERPPAGPKLFIANHPSASDPFLIHLLSEQHMAVLLSTNAYKFPVLGFFVRRAGQIEVMPGKGEQILDQARELFKVGCSVAIFPEGTFSPQQGGYQEPKSGAARLALSTGVPVIPVGIHLLRERLVTLSSKVKGKETVGYWYVRGPYGVTVGKSMQFEGNPDDKTQIHATTKSMMQRIHALALESQQRLQQLMPATASA
ncbi:MAG: lysophospholipid acyltransferase family protein [Chloroflexota bacterium]